MVPFASPQEPEIRPQGWKSESAFYAKIELIPISVLPIRYGWGIIHYSKESALVDGRIVGYPRNLDNQKKPDMDIRRRAKWLCPNSQLQLDNNQGFHWVKVYASVQLLRYDRTLFFRFYG